MQCVDMNKDGDFMGIGLCTGEIIILKVSTNFTKFEQCDTKRQREAIITDIK